MPTKRIKSKKMQNLKGIQDKEIVPALEDLIRVQKTLCAESRRERRTMDKIVDTLVAVTHRLSAQSKNLSELKVQFDEVLFEAYESRGEHERFH